MPEFDGGRPKPNFMDLRFPAKAENVAFARVTVAAFATQLPFTLEEIDEIKVATSEAVSNCVIHGYPDGEGIIEIRTSIKDQKLQLEITDTGVGIADLDAAKEPSFSTDPERMGLGLVFMESFMDSLEIETYLGRGTKAVMTKSPADYVHKGDTTDTHGYEPQ